VRQARGESKTAENHFKPEGCKRISRKGRKGKKSLQFSRRIAEWFVFEIRSCIGSVFFATFA
jgi:hypothetical protein